VPALHKGFTPTDEEIAQAESVLATCAAAQVKDGAGACKDGTVIDASRAAIAANLIAWAVACTKREQGRAAVIAQTQATAQPKA